MSCRATDTISMVSGSYSFRVNILLQLIVYEFEPLSGQTESRGKSGAATHRIVLSFKEGVDPRSAAVAVIYTLVQQTVVAVERRRGASLAGCSLGAASLAIRRTRHSLRKRTQLTHVLKQAAARPNAHSSVQASQQKSKFTSIGTCTLFKSPSPKISLHIYTGCRRFRRTVGKRERNVSCAYTKA